MIIITNVRRSEYGAFWKCIQTGLIYALTQLGKMLVLATFFPLPSSGLESIDGGGDPTDALFIDPKTRLGSVSSPSSTDINPIPHFCRYLMCVFPAGVFERLDGPC